MSDFFLTIKFFDVFYNYNKFIAAHSANDTFVPKTTSLKYPQTP